MRTADTQHPKSWNGGLDLLRAIAILLVVGYHLKAPWLPASLFSRGAIGVDIFFVLSGFLIGDQWLAGLIRGRASFRDFYLRRAFRILPAYWALLLIQMTIVPLDLYARTGPDPLLRHIPLHEIWLYLVFIQNYFFDINRFGASWSLCVEEHFYLLFPLGAALLHRANPRRVIPVLGGILVLYVPYLFALWAHFQPSNQTEYFVHFYQPSHVRVMGIGYGVLLAAVKNYRGDLWEQIKSSPGKCYLAAAFFQGLAWTTNSLTINLRLLHFAYPRYSPLAISLFPAFFSLSIACVIAAFASNRFRGWRWSAFVASISYSWYLSNDLVFDWMRLRAVSPWLELPASLLVAVTLHYAIEKPFLRLRDSLI